MCVQHTENKEELWTSIKRQWEVAELLPLFQSFPSNQMRFEPGHWIQKVATPKWQPLNIWFLHNSSKTQNDVKVV